MLRSAFSRFAPLASRAAAGASLRPVVPLAARSLATITYSPPAVKIGKPAPTFTAGAVVDGEIKKISLADYKGSYVCLLFYPKDYTFVCPTEIIAFSDAAKRFADVNTKVIAISCDTEEVHLSWVRTPRKKGGLGHMQIPLVADTTKAISADYGVLVEEIGIPLRGLFIIDPQGVLQQIIVNNFPVGRDVSETIRLIQAYQFVAEHGEVCPAGWKPGDKTMKADPDGSMDYFSQVEDNDAIEVGPKIAVAKTSAEFDSILKSSPKVVAALSAPYCGKCRQIQPFVDQLSEDFSDVKFVKVDTSDDALSATVSKLNAAHLPGFFFFKNGKQTDQAPVLGYKKSPLKEAVTKLSKS